MKTIKSKVALYLSRRTILELIEFGRSIVQKMTGNPNFVTPDPSLPEVTTGLDELDDAEKQKKAIGIENRNNKLYAVHDLLTQLAAYVTVIADGDGAIIESAGMPVAKAHHPKEEPGTVMGIKVRDGAETAQAIVSHGGAGSFDNDYFTEYTTDMTLSESSWKVAAITGKRKVVVKDLTTGVRTAFRVRAKNSAGYGPYSSIVFRIIQ